MTHRIRHIAGGLGVVAAVVLTGASPALASGETIGSCAIDKAIEAEEHLAESGIAFHSLHHEELTSEFESLEKEMEACLEAPSLIIPELDEIIWGGAAFLVLFYFMVRKGFPAVNGAMNDRADKIASDLDAADQAKAAALRTQSDYEAQLADSKAEGARLVDDARTQADELKQELQARAEADIAEQRARAAADMESSRQQAINDLRSEVSSIAVGAAERVVGASLDASTHSALIDQYIDEVAGSNG